MLGDRVALARRQCDIGGGHVVVQIDKGAPPLAGGQRARDRRRGGGRVRAVVARSHAGALAAASPDGPKPHSAAARAPAASPSARQAASGKLPFAAPAQATAASLSSGTERRETGIEAQPAARLREKLHVRVPAARYGQQIAVERRRVRPAPRRCRRDSAAPGPGAAPPRPAVPTTAWPE